MHPILFQKGIITIYSYGVMVAFAALLVIFLCAREVKNKNISSQIIYDLGFWVVFSAIVGARLFYVILHWSYFFAHPLEIIMLNRGGLVFYGGLILSLLVSFIYIKVKELDFWELVCIIIPYIPLGHAIGRIGCFLNGCCYGKEINAFQHPTQLYAAAFNLFIFLTLLFIRKRYFVGKIILGLYLVLYGFSRFMIEFLRGDEVLVVYSLRVSQWVSLVMIVVGLILLRKVTRETR